MQAQVKKYIQQGPYVCQKFKCRAGFHTNVIPSANFVSLSKFTFTFNQFTQDRISSRNISCHSECSDTIDHSTDLLPTAHRNGDIHTSSQMAFSSL